jgi:transglutaminase-like putative cysteine protease
MIEAARSLSFAARFVSGYLAAPLDDPAELASHSARGSTHAWAQVYLLIIVCGVLSTQLRHCRGPV